MGDPGAQLKALYRNDTFRETDHLVGNGHHAPGHTAQATHARGSNRSSIEGNNELELRAHETADGVMVIRKQAMARDREGTACLDGNEIDGLQERSALAKTFDASVQGPAEGRPPLDNAGHTDPIARR